MAQNLPARREDSGTRFPERRQSREAQASYTITDSPPPRTEYVYVKDKDQGRTFGGTPQSGKTLTWMGGPLKKVPVPKGVPAALGNAKFIGYMWVLAMIVVSFDEWHNHGILPRPSRLWWTSLTYGILAIFGMIDSLIPLMNALALGYTIMLFTNYYSGSGQFGE
jgi:hypothetical protein